MSDTFTTHQTTTAAVVSKTIADNLFSYLFFVAAKKFHFELAKFPIAAPRSKQLNWKILEFLTPAS